MDDTIFNRMEGNELRRRAEEWLRDQNGTGEDLFRLIHELQTQQTELERQNEELRYAISQRDRIVLLLSTSNEPHETAPMGYIALDRNGTIRAVNLTAANFIGLEPSHLITTSLRTFITETDHSSFNAFLDSIFDHRDTLSCELTLIGAGGSRYPVRMEAVVIESGEECLLAVNELSERSSTPDETKNGLPRGRQLKGIIPICVYCKKIRDDHEIWQQLERYISEHSEALFSHGICPECSEKVLSTIKEMKLLHID
ncbi:MAG: PAS domain-containing protein [Desulfuromonadales bacterium]|nr:PAS domain-containing protein [Desulfuromonadales bacterium]